jgi:hypothetical protein
MKEVRDALKLPQQIKKTDATNEKIVPPTSQNSTLV